MYGATDPCAIWVALVEDPGQIQSPCTMHGLLELITFSRGRFKRGKVKKAYFSGVTKGLGVLRFEERREYPLFPVLYVYSHVIVHVLTRLKIRYGCMYLGL